MGKRGPMPGTGGRPPKALAEKIGAGNPGKRLLMVMGAPETAILECVEMPAPKDYMRENRRTAGSSALRKYTQKHGNGLSSRPSPPRSSAWRRTT